VADFCKQCSIDMFGEDLGDMAGLCKEDEVVSVLCEGCGPTCVDSEGSCQFHAEHKPGTGVISG
jgi:hypothetical protein